MRGRVGLWWGAEGVRELGGLRGRGREWVGGGWKALGCRSLPKVVYAIEILFMFESNVFLIRCLVSLWDTIQIVLEFQWNFIPLFWLHVDYNKVKKELSGRSHIKKQVPKSGPQPWT